MTLRLTTLRTHRRTSFVTLPQGSFASIPGQYGLVLRLQWQTSVDSPMECVYVGWAGDINPPEVGPRKIGIPTVLADCLDIPQGISNS